LGVVVGRNPKAENPLLIDVTGALGSGFWLYLYFLKEKK